MWVKPPFIAVLFVLGMAIYSGYLTYQVWFTPRKLLMSSRKRIHKFPRWYPLRGIATAMINNDKGWINFNKSMAIFVNLFILLLLALVLIAWFIGN